MNVYILQIKIGTNWVNEKAFLYKSNAERYMKSYIKQNPESDFNIDEVRYFV